MARKVHLSFLDEEEAQQIFHVLERNSRLKRAKRERISLDLDTNRRMSSLKQKHEYFPKLFKKPHSRTQSQVLRTEETIQDIVLWALAQALCSDKKTIHQPIQPLGQSPRLSLSLSHSRKMRFQPSHKKIFGGDLLDIHRQCFTETRKPFIPKVLKTPNKAFLSKYRYYNSPHRKKTFSSDKPSCKNPGKFYRVLEDECVRSYADYLMQHPLKKHKPTSISLPSLLQAKALGDVFQIHVRNRRCDLDEVKMQQLFHSLKEDLNYYTDLPDPSISYSGLEHRSDCLIAPNM